MPLIRVVLYDSSGVALAVAPRGEFVAQVGFCLAFAHRPVDAQTGESPHVDGIFTTSSPSLMGTVLMDT